MWFELHKQEIKYYNLIRIKKCFRYYEEIGITPYFDIISTYKFERIIIIVSILSDI